jgi:hypothetical protein
MGCSDFQEQESQRITYCPKLASIAANGARTTMSPNTACAIDTPTQPLGKPAAATSATKRLCQSTRSSNPTISPSSRRVYLPFKGTSKRDDSNRVVTTRQDSVRHRIDHLSGPSSRSSFQIWPQRSVTHSFFPPSVYSSSAPNGRTEQD